MSGKDKCNSLDLIPLGSVVDVEFVLNGVMYTKDGQERNFTKLTALSVEVIRDSATPKEPDAPAKTESDDLPFD